MHSGSGFLERSGSLMTHFGNRLPWRREDGDAQIVPWAQEVTPDARLECGLENHGLLSVSLIRRTHQRQLNAARPIVAVFLKFVV
jgi:hypothetical protein